MIQNFLQRCKNKIFFLIFGNPNLEFIIKYYLLAQKIVNKIFYFTLRGKFNVPQKISTSLAWLKKTNRLSDFIIIFNSRRRLRQYPKNQEVPPHEIQREINRNFIRGSYIASFSDAYVFGEKGSIITEDHTLISDLSMHLGFKNEENDTFSKIFMKKVIKTNKTIAVLSTDAGNTFYHWLYDVLPRFYLLQKQGIEPDLFYINYNGLPFQKDSLRILKIDKKKIVRASNKFIFQSSKLIVPSIIRGNMDYWVIDFLKRIFISSFKDEDMGNKNRIYISRQKANGRKIINEKDFLNFIKNFGFKKVFLEDLSLTEQFRLFYFAEMVIGPHGAGFSNIFCCRPKTKIIEIFSEKYINPCYYSISEIAGLEYYYYIEISKRKKNKSFGFRENIKVDINSFKHFFKLVIN